MMPNVQVNTL